MDLLIDLYQALEHLPAAGVGSRSGGSRIHDIRRARGCRPLCGFRDIVP